jgi:hypothetical protein
MPLVGEHCGEASGAHCHRLGSEGGSCSCREASNIYVVNAHDGLCCQVRCSCAMEGDLQRESESKGLKEISLLKAACKQD